MSFKTKRGVIFINLFADGPFYGVGGIKLNAGKRGKTFHIASAFFVIDSGALFQIVFGLAVNAIVEIESVTKRDHVFVGKHVFTQLDSALKGKRSSVDIHKFVMRNKLVVNGRNARRFNFQHLVKDIVAVAYVEIRMVSKIAQSIFIRYGVIFKHRLVIVGKGIADLYI